ncbi:hypothetical protein LDENG_00083860 [Lucifuga dentata]|nr:hypothetical protein LDENG_00083860 [Lucifuga dentata]
MVGECQKQGWQAQCIPTEMGCRGFVGQSFYRALKLLGITVKMPSKTPQRLQRRHPDDYGSRGGIYGLHRPLRHKPGPDQPWMGHLGEDV